MPMYVGWHILIKEIWKNKLFIRIFAK